MSEKDLLNRLGNRFVLDALVAEKRWIVQTLSKIRLQRNCLQIERLHLESLKTQLKGGTKSTEKKDKPIEPDINAPTTSAVNLMQSVPKSTEIAQVSEMGVTDAEIICNEQELDLMISNCIFGNGDGQSYNMEEDEDDEDDIMIDMNMLMNGNPK